MAVVKDCAFRFKSPLMTNGAWSDYMFCTVATFKEWFAVTGRLNECAIPAYPEQFPILTEVQVHVARTDRTFVWKLGTGWRDTTDEAPQDIKEQLAPPHLRKVPTDDDIYGTSDQALHFANARPLASGVYSDLATVNDELRKRMDIGWTKYKFYDTWQFSLEGKIG